MSGGSADRLGAALPAAERVWCNVQCGRGCGKKAAGGAAGKVNPKVRLTLHWWARRAAAEVEEQAARSPIAEGCALDGWALPGAS